MQKEIVAHSSDTGHGSGGEWMNLDTHARVRLTSEDPAFPIEAALEGTGAGWKSAQAGPQTVWIEFNAAESVDEIYLCFECGEQRTHEFVLSWSNNGGASYREIVRQQFNFSPEGARTQEEHYMPHLANVTDLKLTITPDISNGPAVATLKAFRVR